jgi:fructokinase
MDKITAIGEILYDVYPKTKNLGGAPLNFLYHVHKLTGKGNIISRVGNDVLGNNTVDFLQMKGISTNHVQVDHHHPTGVTTVVLDENKVPSFMINEDRAYDFIESTPDILKLIGEETDCLYFGSLAQRNTITRETIQSLLGKKIKYFCDLNIRQNFYTEEVIHKSLLAADILKINLDELKLINQLILKKEFSIKAITSDLTTKYNIEFLAVTKGEDGSTLFYNNEIDNFKVSLSQVVDTLGAGDAFAAVLCIGYLMGWKLDKTNKLANEFAKEICKINGALPETDNIYNELKEKMSNDY